MVPKNLLSKTLKSVSSLVVTNVLLGCALTFPSWAMDKDTPPTKTVARSLVFLDGYQGSDHFNFLYTKHQKNGLIIDQSKEIPKEKEEERAQYILSQHVPSKYPTETDFVTALMMQFASPVYNLELCELDASNAMALKTTELVDTEKHFGSKILSTLENLIYNFQKSLKRTVLDDILIGAEQIDHIQVTEGVCPILFLGRTPCFLQVAYEEVCKFYHPARLNDSHILHLNFSGTPDIENLRNVGSLGYEKITAKNLVSPEKLQFYCKYMDGQKMNTVKDKLYLVDMVGTGASLNSFLRLGRYYYTEYLGREEMPDIEFIALNLKYKSGSKTSVYTFNSCTQEIYFHSGLEDFGVRPLKIKTTPIHMSYGTMKALDYSLTEDFLCSGVCFPAQKWRNECLDELKKGGLCSKFANALFRRLLQPIIKEHDNFYKTEVAKTLN